MESDAKSAALSQMMFQANSKSVGVAYLLWFFLGGFGGHRFYMGQTGTAIAQLIMTLIGIGTAIIGIGFILLAVVGIWVLVDAFLIPGIVRNHNVELAQRVLS